MPKAISAMNKSITKEEIAELPIRAFEGKINVPLTEEEIYAAVDYLRRYPVLGFDTETRPNFRKGQHNNVALLQLSAGNEAFLFRLNKIKLPEVVKQLLADESITKVGAAIHDGSLYLWSFKGSACDGNHGASAMLSIVDSECLAQSNLKLECKLQLWSLGYVGLWADCYHPARQQGHQE